MHLAKRSIFIGGGLLVAVMALMLVFSAGNGNNEAEAVTDPAGDLYVCFDVTGGAAAPTGTTVTDKFGAVAYTFENSKQYCEPVGKGEAAPATTVAELVCYPIVDGEGPYEFYDFKTQFGDDAGQVQNAKELCLPGGKDADPAAPTTPVYTCYAVKGPDAKRASVDLNSENLTATGVVVGIANRLCAPASTSSKAGTPPGAILLCFSINVASSGSASVTDNVATHSFTRTLANSLCVPTTQDLKVSGTGNLSGIADILVHLDDKNLQAFYCKARTDHAADNTIKTAVTCFSDTPGQNAPGNKVPINPEIELGGPPPPPPYGNGAPQKGEGSWDPGTDVLTVTTCFESLGGTLGPNVIAVLTIPNAKASLPNQSGITNIFFGQGIAACNDLTPEGDPTQTLPINVDTYDTPPYDNITSVDSDGDGCPDAFELDKTRSKKDCGKDPWNPHDSDLNFTGIFTITVEVIRADTCDGEGGPVGGPPPIGCTGAAEGDILSGSYFNCQAVLDHDKGDNSITGKAFCYTDNAVTTVNMEDNGGAIICLPFPSANPEDCGDGLPGSPPPGPFGDNDGETTPGVITGHLDKDKNKLILDICFEGIANPAIGPFAYAQIEVDAHTVLGTVDIWLQQQSCVKPTSAPGSKKVGVAFGEQDDDYDVDQDGCTTAEELDTNPFGGGLRDPYNKYDHMDINKDGFINIPDDILPTAALFGPIDGPNFKTLQGNVGPRMTGSVPWAHRNGDTAINIPDDILGMAAQFGHNCDGTPGA